MSQCTLCVLYWPFFYFAFSSFEIQLYFFRSSHCVRRRFNNMKKSKQLIFPLLLSLSSLHPDSSSYLFRLLSQFALSVRAHTLWILFCVHKICIVFGLWRQVDLKYEQITITAQPTIQSQCTNTNMELPHIAHYFC